MKLFEGFLFWRKWWSWNEQGLWYEGVFVLGHTPRGTWSGLVLVLGVVYLALHKDNTDEFEYVLITTCKWSAIYNICTSLDIHMCCTLAGYVHDADRLQYLHNIGCTS